jgi:hypothetical protein
MHQIHIGMLGPRGVGKTSLLAVMYNRFGETVGPVDLELNTSQDIRDSLQGWLEVLTAMPGKLRHGFDSPIPNTVKHEEYQFLFGRKARAPTLQIVFHDYPGEYHKSKLPEDHKTIEDVANKCAAVLVPVDAPGLIEDHGNWHHSRNSPQAVTDVLKDAYRSLDSPRLVILAPVRCDT